MEKIEVSSKESLDPPMPPSSHSDERYAMVNVNRMLADLHRLPGINDRILTQSVPSPGVGHLY